MLTIDEARTRVLAAVEPGPAVDVDVEGSFGLVTCEDVFAPYPNPRFDNSAMDGYAVRAQDVADASEGSPVRLRIVGESKAGLPTPAAVAPGTAIRIMTGAALPTGADAIVIVEDTEEHDGSVTVRAPAGAYIRRAGEDLDAGDVAVPAGTELDSGALAMLAALGVSSVKVHRRPRVALLVTGDELTGPEADLAPGAIRDSNSIALQTLTRAAGAEVSFYSRVPDDLSPATEVFRTASEHADVVVSSGGVAMGRFDIVRDVVEQLGRIDLWRVAMQPGRPVVLGTVGRTPFLGLPGNPVSVHVSFEQFVRPAIRKMLGCSRLLRPRLPARLTEDLHKKAGRLHLVRVRLAWAQGTLQATPTGAQGSHIQSSLVACDGLALFPRDAEHLRAGTEVTVEVWNLPPA